MAVVVVGTCPGLVALQGSLVGCLRWSAHPQRLAGQRAVEDVNHLATPAAWTSSAGARLTLGEFRLVSLPAWAIMVLQPHHAALPGQMQTSTHIGKDAFPSVWM